MSGIYSWIKNIVCFLCIINIFLQILPGKNYKKYVRFFGGLLLIVIVMGPFANMAKVSGKFEQVWRMESLREEYDEMKITSQGVEELRSETINKAYKEELKRQVEEVVMAYGFVPEETELMFATGTGGVSSISAAKLKVSVKAVADGRENETGNKQEQVGVPETNIEGIKNELKEVYHISMEHINISIQE